MADNLFFSEPFNLTDGNEQITVRGERDLGYISIGVEGLVTDIHPRMTSIIFSSREEIDRFIHDLNEAKETVYGD